MTPSRRSATWAPAAAEGVRLAVAAARDLVELAAPPLCAACGRDAGSPLCPGCLARCHAPPGPACRRCGNGWQRDRLDTGVCGRCRRFGRPFAFETAAALWRYAGPARELVQAFKFHGRGDCLAPLGRRLAVEPRLRMLWREGGWLVVPVPARRASRRGRGYDQAVLLAEALAARARLACEPGALARRSPRGRASAPQAGAPLDRRRAAMRGALRARPAVLAGRPVLLVDDVLSTGATADAASRALRLAGAPRVRVLALAT